MTLPPSRVLLRYFAVLLGLLIVGTITELTLGVRGHGRTSPVLENWPFLDMWVRWDAGWYEQIALRGYTFSATEQSAAAFFPTYPLLMRAVIFVTGINVFIAGTIVTIICGALAAIVFSKWAALLRPNDASLATWLLLLWPFAFYVYGAVYSDALFLLCITSAFFNLERGRTGWATFFGIIATATRPIAPAVVIGLTLRSLERRRASGERLRPIDFLPVFAGLGLAGFMAFLWWRFGDPFAFATTQAGWGQLGGPETWLKYGALSKFKPVDLTFPALHAALAFLCLGLAWPMRKTLGWGYSAYVAVAIGIPIVTSRDFIGLGRYALAVFPVFLQLAIALDTKVRQRAWFAFASAILVLMTVRFAQAYYTS
ncbi:MAG: mannosyltransferase family protein [Archangium sp.]